MRRVGMDNKHFTVMIAGIAKTGMEGYVKKYLTELMKHSQKDEGCITYNIHQSCTNPREFMVYMVWDDPKDFYQHNQKPEMQEFKKELASEIFEQQSPTTYWKLLGN